MFLTRYLDLFTTFYSYYNSIMKILFICSTATIVFMIRTTEPFKSSYDREQDSFLHWKFAVLPTVLIALVTHLTYYNFDIRLMELFWIFSIYLESIAILPQLVLLQRYREIENLTATFVLFMGLYRAFYIFNWVYRSYHERFYQHHYVVYFCGVLQTLLYIDFFYYYIKSVFFEQRTSFSLRPDVSVERNQELVEIYSCFDDNEEEHEGLVYRRQRDEDDAF